MLHEKTPIQTFKLQEKGLTHIFGELEAKLMEAVWALNAPSVKDVIDHLGGDLNYKTAMTVLNRLVEKGILIREKAGRQFLYKPVSTRESLLADVFDQMIRGMLGPEFRQIALTQMIKTAQDVDPDLLDDMTRLIERRKSSDETTP